MSCFLPGFIFDFPVNAGLISEICTVSKMALLISNAYWVHGYWDWGSQEKEVEAGNTNYGRFGHPCLPVQTPTPPPPPPPPPRRVLYVCKRFLSCREREPLFVILLSNLNGWFSTKCHLWVTLCNKIRESDFFFFFGGLLWLGFRKFSLKNSDKNKLKKSMF